MMKGNFRRPRETKESKSRGEKSIMKPPHKYAVSVYKVNIIEICTLNILRHKCSNYFIVS